MRNVTFRLTDVRCVMERLTFMGMPVMQVETRSKWCAHSSTRRFARKWPDSLTCSSDVSSDDTYVNSNRCNDMRRHPTFLTPLNNLRVACVN